MADSTQLSMTEDRRLAVTKRATAGPHAERLRHEAEALRQASHPGVVELIDESVDGEGGVAVRTAFVGGGTLAEHLGTIDEQRGAQVAAALAATLADLHERGISHGRLTPDHVLVTDDDQVRLCGFADAVYRSDASPCDAGVAAIDVEALATLLRAISESIPSGAASLDPVADRVLGADPLARPSMRSLAQALAPPEDAIPRAGSPPGFQGRLLLPTRHSHPGRLPRLPRTRTHLLALAVIAVVVASVTAVLAASSTSPGPLSPRVAAAPSPPPSPHPSLTTTTLAHSSVPTSAGYRGGVRVWPPQPQPDPEVVEVAVGIISSSGRRWQVASADDLVAVGDWDCDGLATPAVVRHGTGQVWVYDEWAEGREATLVEAAAAVPDAASAAAVDGDVGGDGCDDLEVTDVAGQTTRLDLEKPRPPSF